MSCVPYFLEKCIVINRVRFVWQIDRYTLYELRPLFSSKRVLSSIEYALFGKLIDRHCMSCVFIVKLQCT